MDLDFTNVEWFGRQTRRGSVATKAKAKAKTKGISSSGASSSTSANRKSTHPPQPASPTSVGQATSKKRTHSGSIKRAHHAGHGNEAQTKSERPLRVGTDCSGWDSLLMALMSMNLALSHVFACDIEPSCRETITANYTPKKLYKDIAKRKVDEMEEVDVYHAGFPCQPFSIAGKRLGEDDPKMRGMVIYHVLRYIKKKLPKVVFLENVKGLPSMFPELLAHIKSELVAAGYHVQDRVLNAVEHGVPQNRERWFLIGIRGGSKWSWPNPIPAPALSTFLDGNPKKEEALNKSLPPISQTSARKHVKSVIEQCQEAGIKMCKSDLVVDIDSKSLHMMDGVSPCLTKTRCSNGGHWIVSRGRRMTVAEMQRLQGVGVKPQRPSLAVVASPHPSSQQHTTSRRFIPTRPKQNHIFPLALVRALPPKKKVTITQ